MQCEKPCQIHCRLYLRFWCSSAEHCTTYLPLRVTCGMHCRCETPCFLFLSLVGMDLHYLLWFFELFFISFLWPFLSLYQTFEAMAWTLILPSYIYAESSDAASVTLPRHMTAPGYPGLLNWTLSLITRTAADPSQSFRSTNWSSEPSWARIS